MPNNNRPYYFGKLRRRREFIKPTDLVNDYYYGWEVWFNKCSNTNSLLPFLSNKNKVRPIWLFIINKDEILKIGFTTLSLDMVSRNYPFLIYYENKLTESENDKSLLNYILPIASKFEKFIKVISNGNFTEDEEKYFAVSATSYGVPSRLQELLNVIVLNILEKKYDSTMNSYWVNLDNFSTIHHQGALTCTLYNKIYG